MDAACNCGEFTDLWLDIPLQNGVDKLSQEGSPVLSRPASGGKDDGACKERTDVNHTIPTYGIHPTLLAKNNPTLLGHLSTVHSLVSIKAPWQAFPPPMASLVILLLLFAQPSLIVHSSHGEMTQSSVEMI